MPQTNSDSRVEVPEVYDDDIDKWATAAVRGANNWLVTLRNATDEGIKEWSDEFTGGKNGIMTYSEGLTALALTKQFAPVDRPNWQTLRPRYYQKDLKHILDKISSEDGPKFESAPYLIEESSDEEEGVVPYSQDFTVAATFSTSAILESLKAGVELGDKIDESDIKKALDTNLNWLLSNKVDGDEVEDGAAGWAWIGSQSSQYDSTIDEPMNYFTYSAVIALCDLLDYRGDIELVDSVVSDHEDELISTIKEANNFLLEQYWEENCWTTPALNTSPQEKLLSTCYAFIGLSYIEFVLENADTAEGVDVTEEQEKRMGKAMNWTLNYNEETENIWTTTVEYDCGEDQDDPTFTDGSAPYVLIDSILELVNFRPSVIEHVTDFEREEIRKIIREDLTPTVLDKCWAGDDDFEEKGFRHIQSGKRLLKSPDGAPGTNMTAIYSTGVAMETFLLNFLEEGEKISEKTSLRSTSQSVDADSEKEDTAEAQRTETKTVNNIILDGENSSYPDEIDEQLRNIRTEIEKISKEVGDSAQGGKIRTKEFEERSREFMKDLTEFQSVLSEEYDDNWVDVIDTLGSSKRSMSQSMEDYEEEFKKRNTEMFVEYISELYFCPDRETYEKEVKISENDSTLLLPPQREVYDEVEEWEDEDFADEEARKSYIEETVEELTEEPWGGQSVGDTVREFDSRFEEEVIEN